MTDTTVSAYGVVSKGNGDAFLMDEKHMSLSLGGGRLVRVTHVYFA